MGGRCLHHKFTLEANEFQAGLDKPHEHVIDLKAESEIQDVIKKKKMSLGARARNTSGSEMLVRPLVTVSAPVPLCPSQLPT